MNTKNNEEHDSHHQRIIAFDEKSSDKLTFAMAEQKTNGSLGLSETPANQPPVAKEPAKKSLLQVIDLREKEEKQKREEERK